MRTRLLATTAGAALAALAFTSWLIAQPIVQNQLSGQECWNAGQGPAGPSTGFLCTNLVRGGTAQSVLSAVTGAVTIGTATGNFTVTGTPNPTALVTGGNLLITAQPSAATFTLPPNPVPDGMTVGVCNASNAAFATNVVAFGANTGQTCAAPCSTAFTTLAAGSCAQVQWNQSQATWYRIR